MPPAEEEEQGQRIYDAAQRCDHLFQQLQSTLASNGGFGERLYPIVRDHYRRFDLWAGFIGVFAEHEASLDTRLRFYPEVRDLVLQMLNLLASNLGHGR
jgi:hypothetical protein